MNNVYQIVSMKTVPKENHEVFFTQLKKAGITACSVTSEDLFGYCTVLVNTTKEIAEMLAMAMMPARINEVFSEDELPAGTWKTVN